MTSLTLNLPKTILRSLPQVLRALVLFGAALFVLAYLIVAIGRMAYPYELEWIEGGNLQHVERVLSGKPVYVEPSLSFTAFLYPPLYYYASATVALILGPSFFSLRLLSFLSSLGCFVLLGAFVKRETGSTFCAFISAALFAAMFSITGFWFDLARVDSLFLLFILGSIYLLRFSEGWLSSVLAGALMTLAFLTKQSALVVAAPLGLYCVLLKRGWCRIAFPATFLVLGGVSLLGLNRATNGWCAFYLFGMPSHYPIMKSRLFTFWTRNLLHELPLGCVLAFACLCRLGARSEWKRAAFLLALAAGLLGASWCSWPHAGAVANVLIPAYAMMAIFFGLGIHMLQALSSPSPGNGSDKEAWADAAISFLCLCQFLVLVYNPLIHIPTRADRAVGDRLVQKVASFGGEVYIPCHGYLANLAGKPSYAHAIAVLDALDAESVMSTRLQDGIAEAIRQRRFDAIILDGTQDFGRLSFERHFLSLIEENYERRGAVVPGDKVFRTREGGGSPRELYVRRAAGQQQREPGAE